MAGWMSVMAVQMVCDEKVGVGLGVGTLAACHVSKTARLGAPGRIGDTRELVLAPLPVEGWEIHA
jgi:hypothetical protein